MSREKRNRFHIVGKKINWKFFDSRKQYLFVYFSAEWLSTKQLPMMQARNFWNQLAPFGVSAWKRQTQRSRPIANCIIYYSVPKKNIQHNMQTGVAAAAGSVEGRLRRTGTGWPVNDLPRGPQPPYAHTHTT